MRVAGTVGDYTISVTDKFEHVVIEHVDGGKQALQASQVDTAMGLIRQAASIARDATTPHTTGMVGDFTAAVGDGSTVLLKCAGTPLFDLAHGDAHAVANLLGTAQRLISAGNGSSAPAGKPRPTAAPPEMAVAPRVQANTVAARVVEKPAQPRAVVDVRAIGDPVTQCIDALKAGASR